MAALWTPGAAMADSPPGWGEPVPFFTAVTDGVPNYSIQVAAGRWMVLMVFGSLGNPACAEALARVLERRALFDDRDALFFGVTIDPADRLERGLCNSEPGIRFFWDLDRTVCMTLGVIDSASLRLAGQMPSAGQKAQLPVLSVASAHSSNKMRLPLILSKASNATCDRPIALSNSAVHSIRSAT